MVLSEKGLQKNAYREVNNGLFDWLLLVMNSVCHVHQHFQSKFESSLLEKRFPILIPLLR